MSVGGRGIGGGVRREGSSGGGGREREKEGIRE